MRQPKETKWGGSREGAGRPLTGRKRRFYYVTDEEDVKLREYLNRLRQPPKQAVFSISAIALRMGYT